MTKAISRIALIGVALVSMTACNRMGFQHTTTTETTPHGIHDCSPLHERKGWCHQ